MYIFFLFNLQIFKTYILTDISLIKMERGHRFMVTHIRSFVSMDWATICYLQQTASCLVSLSDVTLKQWLKLGSTQKTSFSMSNCFCALVCQWIESVRNFCNSTADTDCSLARSCLTAILKALNDQEKAGVKTQKKCSTMFKSYLDKHHLAKHLPSRLIYKNL